MELFVHGLHFGLYVSQHLLCVCYSLYAVSCVCVCMIMWEYQDIALIAYSVIRESLSAQSSWGPSVMATFIHTPHIRLQL